MCNEHSTTPAMDARELAEHLTALIASAEQADAMTDQLDADLSWDVGLELLSARAALSRARALLDRAGQPAR